MHPFLSFLVSILRLPYVPAMLFPRALALALIALEPVVATAAPIRPLANDFVAVGVSPAPAEIQLYSPAILRLDDGRLVAAYSQFGKARDRPKAFIFTSDDHGLTWTQRAEMRMTQARLFTAGNAIYFLGQNRDLQIARSDNRGETWSNQVALSQEEWWHQTPANVWHTRGNVYLVMERRTSEENATKAWQVGELAPVLMRARVDADLTRRESWTFASELVFADLIPGYKENNPALEFFGVPFFTQAYPNRAPVSTAPVRRTNSPMGWLETNVVQITDPDHMWYDPSGHTFHLFMRAHTAGTGYATIAKVVEQADGSMVTQLESAPSGKKLLFLPFPGGQMRFHVCYDEKTKLYWMLGSQSTDSMTRPDRLPVDRFDLPNNERNRLVLHFSKNMVDWCFAGLVAKTDSPKESRHYASMDIDGDDFVILSRSGDERAKNAHDGNIITFHRVKNFRDLVY